MLFLVLIGASVFTTCFGESASIKAVSSQSYERGDVPLYYKHNILHIYTTSKPHEHLNLHKNNYYQDKRQAPYSYKNIQYAPLPLNNQVDLAMGRLYTEASTPGYTEINVNENVSGHLDQPNAKNTHLEPQLVPQTNEIRPHFVPHVAAYNMNIKKLKNHLENNQLHVSSANGDGNEHPNVPEHFFKHRFAFERPQIKSTQETIDVSGIPEYAKRIQAYSVLAHQYDQDDKIYNGQILPDKEKAELQPVVYVKAPKIQLNVARAYNIARAPYKASINVNSAFRKLHPLPQKTSESQIAQSAKTQLHPVQNRNVYLFHRLT